MVSISPGRVFGPPLGTNISSQTPTSCNLMLRGKMPIGAKITFPVSDVTDVAQLHVQALKNSDAVGPLIIAADIKLERFADLAQILE